MDFLLYLQFGFPTKILVKEGRDLKTLKNTISKYVKEYNITE